MSDHKSMPGQEAQAVVHDEPTETAVPISETGCPDGGTCHHGCETRCWRVRACGPLSGVFPGNRWPREIVAFHNPEGAGKHTLVMQSFLGELALMEWRIYEVQRVAMPTKGDPSKGVWSRSVRSLAAGKKAEMLADLKELGAAEGVAAEMDEDGVWRVHLTRRAPGFPAYERMYVMAPAGVQDKTPKAFHTALAAYLEHVASLEADAA